METAAGGAGEANSNAPVANAGAEKPQVISVMSPDKMEMVCNTLLNANNMRKFGFMLGVTPTGRARPKSGGYVTDFCKFLNSSQPAC